MCGSLDELARFSDEELRKIIYELTNYTMLELGLMSRDELEKAYDDIEVQED